MQAQDHGRVLVVEDDESAAVFVTRVLDRAGFASSWAVDADEATSMLARSSYDVLLTDVRLPGRSGLELVREIRDSRPAIGIAVMTSFNEVGLEREARSLGAEDFFEKPLTPTSLVSRILRLVTRSHRGEPSTESRSQSVGVAAGTIRSSASEPARSLPGTASTPADPSSGCEEAWKGHGSGHGNAAPAAAPARRPDPADPGPLYSSEDSRFIYNDSDAVGELGLGPAFRRIGRAARTVGAVPLWASAMPTVSHVASDAGPVTAPRTSAAWRFSD